MTLGSNFFLSIGAIDPDFSIFTFTPTRLGLPEMMVKVEEKKLDGSWLMLNIAWI
jgi:hypothetical protein